MTGTAALPELERLSDYVFEHASRRPEDVALIGDGMRLDYASLAERVEEQAKALLAAGIDHGDRVAMLAPPHPDFMINLLATASIGAVWLGLNPSHSEDELAYVIEDAAPKLVFVRLGERAATERAIKDAAARFVAPGQCIDLGANGPVPAGFRPYADFVSGGGALSREQYAERMRSVAGRDPCLIVYTSGSTGKPKGALLHHSGIVASSLDQNRHWPVSAQRLLNYFPINHIGSVIDVSCPALVAGGSVIFMESFAPDAALALMARERITIWGSIPTVFAMQLALPEVDSYDLSSVELILWEGAPMPSELLDRLARFERPMATNYGMTETSSAISVLAPTRDREALANSVGHPLPGIDVRLVDEDGSITPAGGTGEIQVRSPRNMLGYWRREAETAAVLLPDGWLRTGDLGRFRDDGRLELRGRIKEMYKSGGYNIYPREIEQKIESCPGVVAVAVIGVDHPLWQEAGVAVIALENGTSLASVADHCRSVLANYKIPKAFVKIAAMPLLPIGKVDKPKLKLLVRDVFAVGGYRASPPILDLLRP